MKIQQRNHGIIWSKLQRSINITLDAKNNELTSKIQKVPKLPEPLKENATAQKQKTHYKKEIIRREWTDRLGYGQEKADNKDLRICPNHSVEMVKKSTSYDKPLSDGNFKSDNFTLEFEDPVAACSMNESAVTQSNGAWVHRELLRYAMKISIEDRTRKRTSKFSFQSGSKGKRSWSKTCTNNKIWAVGSDSQLP